MEEEEEESYGDEGEGRHEVERGREGGENFRKRGKERVREKEREKKNEVRTEGKKPPLGRDVLGVKERRKECGKKGGGGGKK